MTHQANDEATDERHPNNSPKRVTNEGWLSRERALVVVLADATALTFYLCYRLARPFLPALAWGLALQRFRAAATAALNYFNPGFSTPHVGSYRGLGRVNGLFIRPRAAGIDFCRECLYKSPPPVGWPRCTLDPM